MSCVVFASILWYLAVARNVQLGDVVLGDATIPIASALNGATLRDSLNTSCSSLNLGEIQGERLASLAVEWRSAGTLGACG
eukprot:1194298-Amphidinium_carterae.1